MQRKTRSILLLLAVLLSVGGFVSAPGCLGERAREGAGKLTLPNTNDQIVEYARLGASLLPVEEQAEATNDINAFNNAIESKDIVAVRSEAAFRWPLVKAWAMSGVNHKMLLGKIGPGVAASILNSIEEFDQTMTLIGGPR